MNRVIALMLFTLSLTGCYFTQKTIALAPMHTDHHNAGTIASGMQNFDCQKGGNVVVSLPNAQDIITAYLNFAILKLQNTPVMMKADSENSNTYTNSENPHSIYKWQQNHKNGVLTIETNTGKINLKCQAR